MIGRALTLAELLRNERRPRAALLDEQFQRLRALVRHAGTNVPAYRDLWQQHGVGPETLRTPQDLQRFPVVDKATMRRLGVAAFVDERLASTSALVRCSTSGSSGMPFDFWFTPRHDQWRKAQYLRPYLSTGRRLGDRTLRLSAFPATRPRWFERLGLLREYRLDANLDAAEVVERWRELTPDVVQGYGSALRAVALHALGRGLQLPAPRLVYTDSELLRADTRRLLHQAFGTDPLDVFGTFETDNIAWQCEHRCAYHVAIDCAVVEVLDARGAALDAGEGDLVVTVLGNEAMPFIRYNLRDRAAWISGECACGRTLPRLDVTRGRSDDLMLVAGERRSPMRVLEHFDAFGHAVLEYQLRQVHPDEIEIHLVPGPGYDTAIGATLAGLVARDCTPLRATLVLEERIARTAAGKFKAFESRLGVASA